MSRSSRPPRAPSARSIGLWLLALACCLAAVLASTRISREMTFWGIVASALLLIWLWHHFTYGKPSG